MARGVAQIAISAHAVSAYAVIGPELGKSEDPAAAQFNVRRVGIISEMLPNIGAFFGSNPEGRMQATLNKRFGP